MKIPERLEEYRFTTGTWGSKHGEQRYGAFFMPGPCGRALKIIAANADDPVTVGWEHVSVSTERKSPNWIEMCFVKNLFWSEDEWVVQFHPAKADYVNYHPHTLHLWRYAWGDFPTPPSELVGPKAVKQESTVEYERTVKCESTVIQE